MSGQDQPADKLSAAARSKQFGAAEDDGWYLMLVGDRAEGTTTLDVLPAEDPTAGAVAQVHLPVRVPLGFHGNWIPLR